MTRLPHRSWGMIVQQTWSLHLCDKLNSGNNWGGVNSNNNSGNVSANGNLAIDSTWEGAILALTASMSIYAHIAINLDIVQCIAEEPKVTEIAKIKEKILVRTGTNGVLVNWQFLEAKLTNNSI